MWDAVVAKDLADLPMARSKTPRSFPAARARPSGSRREPAPETLNISMPGLGRVETLGEVGLAASQVRVSVRPRAVGHRHGGSAILVAALAQVPVVPSSGR